ncbi:MAG: HTH-like domain-containing protein [Candidatus Nitrotoga sp. MKT]|nr:MAG: HTH-like domain-containing protein [Candidatus Nitrotoga sp. MKT]
MQQKTNIVQACRVLGVSRASYYAARQRAKELAICVASVQIKAAFKANQSCYGSRRVVDVKAQGIVIGRYKVRRLMRKVGFKPIWKKSL